MVDYDKDFIFYNDSDDELVDVSNGIKTAEESANSKKGAKHSPSGAHHYAGVFSYEDENKRKKKKENKKSEPKEKNDNKDNKKDGKKVIRKNYYCKLRSRCGSYRYCRCGCGYAYAKQKRTDYCR